MSHAPIVLPAAGPSSPDYPPTSTPERSHDEDPFQFLSSDNLQGMRNEQKRILSEEQASVGDKLDRTKMKEAEDRAKARYEELYEEYLRSFDSARGLDEDDPKFEEYLNYVAQIGNMDETEWRTGEYINGEKVNESGRDMVDDLHGHLLKEHRAEAAEDEESVEIEEDEPEATPETPPLVVDDETTELPIVPMPVSGERRFTPEQMHDRRDKIEARDQAHANLLGARNHLANLTVKRQGKLGGKVNKEYIAAELAYQEAMIAYGRAGEAMLSTREDSRTDLQKRSDAVEYLLHEAAELRKITNEKWNNTAVNKICAWMARGNLAQRIAKGVLVGAGVSAAAAAVGTVTGGTGLLTVAGAGAAAARIMRAYGTQRGRNLVKGNASTDMTGVEGHTMADRQAFMDRQRNDQEMRNMVDVYGADAILAGGSDLLLDKHEESISAEHKKNRRAAIISIGSIALPAAVVYAGSEVLDHHTGFREAVSDKLHNLFGRPEASLQPPSHPDATGTARLESAGTLPETGLAPAPTSEELLQQLTPEQLAHLEVKPGEGGISFIEGLGGKSSDWYAMQDELLKAHPEDFYRMSDGNVGIAHPGHLSNDTMLDIATRMGYIQ
jgi:hypothetical protein